MLDLSTPAMTRLIADMQACAQTEGQSVYEHGISVRDHVMQLVEYLRTGQISETWILPKWVSVYREPLLKSIAPQGTLEEYTVFHDCGKPYCEPDGRRRFPNHAEVSYFKWLEVGGSEGAARLMRYDMLIHTMKSRDVTYFCSLPEAPTLLLAGLAEVHANAKMFGGMKSTSFKIKWGQINRRGQAVCRDIWNPNNPLVVSCRHGYHIQNEIP
jgi:hypothetical protein